MEQLIDFHAPEVQAVLDTLLKDRSTGQNIIWATDPPEELQTVMYEPVTDKSQITAQQLGLTHYEVVLPRMMKQTDTQQQRTRKKGEVFSPAWVCNKMNNALDADWFRGLGAEESAGQHHLVVGQPELLGGDLGSIRHRLVHHRLQFIRRVGCPDDVFTGGAVF